MEIIKTPASTQKKEEKVRVAVYCRVSTGRCEQEESLETQKQAYNLYVASHQNWELVGIYSDVRSGLQSKKRDGFMRMIQDAYAGKIDLILCKSISRFSRNIVECQRYTEKLKSKQVTVEFEKEHIRTDQPTSNLIFSLMCAIAQDESRSISENMKTAFRHRVEAGVYTPQNNRMLGYDVDNGKYVPNEDAKVIELIFQLFANGVSTSDISRLLGKMGVKGIKSGQPFSSRSVYSILRNETYVGDKTLQKQAPKDFITKRPDTSKPFSTNYLKNDHLPVVTRELWEQVQKRLEKEKQEREKGIRRIAGSHPMLGKVFCGICGAPYMRRAKTAYAKDSTHPVYYYVWGCRERLRRKAGAQCRNRIIREEELLEQLSGCEFENVFIREDGLDIKKVEVVF